MIVVDTSVWIDYFRGIVAPHTDLLDRELSKSRIIIGDLIMTELLQGFSVEKNFQIAMQLMENLEYRDIVGRDMAIAAAQNYRILRRKGITIRKTIDVLIATFCIENGAQLIHNDRDFDPMEQLLGLRVLRDA
jgi:predicted nucleic acid-binding protein